MSTGPGLESLVDRKILNLVSSPEFPGFFRRHDFDLQGVLKGFDQATNIILDESHECVYSTKEFPKKFIKEHGERLSKRVRLEVPTGTESKMKLKRPCGDA